MTRVTARPGVDRIEANMAEHMLLAGRATAPGSLRN
jgi:hypothetical protein